MNRILTVILLLTLTACSAAQIASVANQSDHNGNANHPPRVAARTSGTGPGGLPLASLEFETVTVNLRGDVTDRRKAQASYYIEDPNGVGMEMVQIPAGSFMMGSSAKDSVKPRHLVNVASFYLGKYEVTQAQWRAVASLPKVSRDLNPDPSYFKGDSLPVEQVSWKAAIEFCARLSQATGRAYRLPSEAEWEYACRAGTTTAYGFGDTITSELAIHHRGYPFDAEPTRFNQKGTAPVGSLGIANKFGLYDMHGNVSEWCLDGSHLSYRGAPVNGDPWKPEHRDVSRMIRGGSWADFPQDCSSAARYSAILESGISHIGFRIVEQEGKPKPAFNEIATAQIVSGKAVSLVEGFLAAHPDEHLLALDDIPRPALEEAQRPRQPPHQIAALDLQQPDMLDLAIRERDANGDGIEDVVAIIAREDKGHKLYSVICFNGGKTAGYSRVPFWVVKDSSRFIGGFDVEEAALFKKFRYPSPSTIELHYDGLYPLGEFKDEFFRWNGSQYEQTYFVADEYVMWPEDLKIFSLPHPDSRVVTVLKRKDGEDAPKLRVLYPVPDKLEGVRWYKVQVYKGNRRTSITGFISGANLHRCFDDC